MKTTGGMQCHRRELESLHDEACRWALSCCRHDEERAREVMQTVYVEILSGRAVFRGEAAFRTWLFAVIRRSAQQLHRAEQRSRALRDRLLRLLHPDPAASDACRETERQQDTEAVLTALDRLSPMQRQITELVFYRGFTVDEAALICGIGIGAARTHFHRAKRALARTLAPGGNGT